ncbi:MAG TPA: nucleoside triphosphate pyrophosphatase [Pseudomonadales bacterium]
MNTTTLILASSSPYRRQLLEKLGLPFRQIAADIDERPQAGETPQALAARLARQKAEAVAARLSSPALVIASDQLAVLDQQILGKPGNHQRATEQLSACSGRTVSFLTSLCLWQHPGGSHQLDVVPFSVRFRHLSARHIDNYLQREQPYDCAGSFKAEGLGIALFEEMNGSDINSLVGLPLIRLVDMLATAGVDVLGPT